VVLLGLGVGIWQYWTIAARQRTIDSKTAYILASLARNEIFKMNWTSALRFAALGSRIDLSLSENHASGPVLADAASQADWRYNLRGHADVVTSVTFNPDGTRLATGSWDRSIRIWDPATGRHIASMQPGQSAVQSVAFSPDGSKLVVGVWDNTARI